MTEKTKDMICSMDPEMRKLGMEICRRENPMVWAALLGFIGTQLTSEIVGDIAKNTNIYIGAKIKYKGMDNCPVMVVSSVNIQPLASVANARTSVNGINTTVSGYCLLVTAKYYNKSTQSFTQTQDRIECFEVI